VRLNGREKGGVRMARVRVEVCNGEGGGWRQRGKAAVNGTGDRGGDKQWRETKAQGALVKEADSRQG
jgi:hypothetical protein